MNKKVIVAALALAFGTVAQAADPVNTTGDVTATNNQTATNTTTQRGAGASANDASTTTQDNSLNDSSTGQNNSTGNARADASGASAANNGGTSTSTQENDNDNSTDQNNSTGHTDASGLGAAAANNGATATSNMSESFNTSSATAISELSGTVTGNTINNIGNIARNTNIIVFLKCQGNDLLQRNLLLAKCRMKS